LSMAVQFDPETFDALPWEMRHRLLRSFKCGRTDSYRLRDWLLRHAVMDDVVHVRRRAAVALADWIGAARFVNEVVAPIVEEADAGAATQAIELLLLIGRHPDEAKMHCLTWIKHASPEVRVAAARVLGKWHTHTGSTFNALVKATKDDEWKVRLAAWVALRGTLERETEALDELLKVALHDARVDIRGWAVRAVYRLQGRMRRGFLDIIASLVDDENAEVRRAAMDVLLNSPRERTIQQEFDRIEQMQNRFGMDISNMPHERSYALLKSVIDENTDRVTVYEDHIRVLGDSGAEWIVDKDGCSVVCDDWPRLICITPSGKLPEGDQLVAYVLTMLNDLTAAERITQIAGGLAMSKDGHAK